MSRYLRGIIGVVFVACASLQSGRTEIIKAAEGVLQADTTSIDAFLGLHEEAEVLEKDDLQGWARGFLNLRTCYEGVLSAARAGAALVYAVEVVGEPDDIERMATDPVVKSFEPGFVFRQRVVVPSARRPAAFERGCVNEDVLSMDLRLAYQRLLELASKK